MTSVKESRSSSLEADAAAGVHSSIATSKNKKGIQSKLTKRQRRKQGPNPSNTWPQQPKIQSPAARSKAYLRVAGLLRDESKMSSPADARLDPKLDLHSPEMRFGRLLAGTEQRTRHAAVTKLKAYLKGRCDIQNTEGGLSELDLLKLWKGLWHALYLCDKVPVQEELSKRLSELIWCVAGTEEEDEYAGQVYLDMCDDEMDQAVTEDEEGDQRDAQDDTEKDDTDRDMHVDEEQGEEEEDEDEMNIKHCRGAHLAALLVKTFFRTIQREWGNMDKHRIDKFYTLVRLMMEQIFKYMGMRYWNRGIMFLFNDIIRDEVLLQVPSGLRYHLIDIVIPELAKVCTKAPMPLREPTFLDVLDPYFAVLQNVDDNRVHERALEQVLGKFLNEYSFVSNTAIAARQDDDNVEGSDLIFVDVHVGTVANFLFELASDVETQDRYRKPLYDMHKTYLKRLKKIGEDVELGEDDTGIIDQSLAEDQGSADHLTTDPIAEKGGTIPLVVAKPEYNSTQNKRKRGAKGRGIVGPNDLVESESVSEQKKKRKHQNREDDAMDTNKRVSESEDVLTISIAEQKDATKAEKVRLMAERRKKKERSKSNPLPTSNTYRPASDEKHVKFGKLNYSKSHKASMKALKTVDPPSTVERTPEKGILRSKIVKSMKWGKRRSSSSRRNKLAD